MIQGLNFVLIRVPNIAAVRDFYVQQIGLTLEGESPTMVQFNPTASGATVLLLEDANAKTFNHPELWWVVDDVDAEHARLRSAGAKVIEGLQEQPFGRTFTATDPAGNTLYFMQPR